MVQGFLAREEVEDGVEGACAGAVATSHYFDHAQRVFDALELAEARNEGIEGALARDAGVEGGEGSNDVVQEGRGESGVRDEGEGALGVEAAVLDALVEDVAERLEVAGAAGGSGEFVVVGGGGIVWEGLGGGGGGGGGESTEGREGIIKGFVEWFWEKRHRIRLYSKRIRLCLFGE